MTIIHSSSTVNVAQAQTNTQVVTLSGTSGSPNLSNTTAAGSATAQWFWNGDGTVDRHVSGTLTQFQDGVEWIDSQDSPSGTYYVRATYSSGSSPTGGPSLGTWNQIGPSPVIWTWFSSSGSVSGTIKVEISDDASGSPILATGYYQGSATAT